MTTHETLRIDARGMKCPRPIIELAKARRQLAAGAVIEIVADDLAFESDVRAWCETTRNRILALGREGDVVTASVEVAKEA